MMSNQSNQLPENTENICELLYKNCHMVAGLVCTTPETWRGADWGPQAVLCDPR